MTRLDEAIRKLEQSRLKEGQHILEELRKEEPNNPVVLYKLGMCCRQRGTLGAAIEVLEHCIGLAPDFVNACAA